ncbi:MAG: right-handed parallel beta-helix repeat-containing protein, partial [Deltaproteobacteria bacterium]|nr:right-handed parallel beta-helix repeat-containing protein [Deltaproteobacteria bacterium]
MRQKTFLALAGFLALLIVAPLAAYAAGLEEYAYYVDATSGNDSTGDGSESNPWKTLHHAIDQINEGSLGIYTVNVAAETYSTANSEANQDLSIIQNNVTVIGETGSMPVVDGAGATNWSYGIKIEASNVTIRNLGVKSFADWGIRITSGTGNRIEGCEIYDNGYTSELGGGGIWIENCSADIRKNKIHNNYPVGILVEGDEAPASPRIERNEIYAHNIGIGMNGYGTGGKATPSIINNLVYGIDSDLSFDIKCGIGVSAESGGTASPAVYHNTLDGGPSDGIYVLNFAGTITPDIKYNIIGNLAGYGINNIGGSPIIDYNDVWNNSQGNYFGCEGLVGANNISQDPLFSNYELQSGSPCIDAIPTE